MSRRRRPLAALAMVALIGAGCSNGSGETGSTGTAGSSGGNNATDGNKAMKFADCMRDNGVGEFPDPDASGSLTIDGVLNGSSLDPSAPAWKQAIRACKDLQPSGFTGDDEVSPEQRVARLAFAQCMRENGVEDFPDPVDGEPLVDTRKIPSAAANGGMNVINAAMDACRDDAAEAIGR